MKHLKHEQKIPIIKRFSTPTSKQEKKYGNTGSTNKKNQLSNKMISNPNI